MNTTNLRGRKAPLDDKMQEPWVIARRVICLTQLVLLGRARDFSDEWINGQEVDFQACASKVASTLKSNDAWSSLTAREKLLVQNKPGSWDDYDEFDYEDHLNQLGTLLWTLSLIENLPLPGEEFSEAYDWLISVMESNHMDFKPAKLRSQSEVSHAMISLMSIAIEEDNDKLALHYRGEARCLAVVWLEWIRANARSRSLALSWSLSPGREWVDKS